MKQTLMHPVLSLLRKLKKIKKYIKNKELRGLSAASVDSLLQVHRKRYVIYETKSRHRDEKIWCRGGGGGGGAYLGGGLNRGFIVLKRKEMIKSV